MVEKKIFYCKGIEMIKKIFVLFFVMLIVAGCGASTLAPVAGELGAAGELVADASTAKEAVVHRTWQKYYEEMGRAHGVSGFHMEYALIEINNTMVYLPSKISFRDTPKMIAPPAEPSKHPVWGTIDNFFNKVTPRAGGYFIADTVLGAFKGVSDNTGTNYHGPVAQIGSHNSAGESVTANLENNFNVESPAENVEAGEDVDEE